MREETGRLILQAWRCKSWTATVHIVSHAIYFDMQLALSLSCRIFPSLCPAR